MVAQRSCRPRFCAGPGIGKAAVVQSAWCAGPGIVKAAGVDAKVEWIKLSGGSALADTVAVREADRMSLGLQRLGEPAALGIDVDDVFVAGHDHVRNHHIAELRAQVEALMARLEEVEQRTEAQSDVNIDTAQAIERLDTTVAKVETKGGLKASSPDKAFEFTLGGRMLYDAYFFSVGAASVTVESTAPDSRPLILRSVGIDETYDVGGHAGRAALEFTVDVPAMTAAPNPTPAPMHQQVPPARAAASGARSASRSGCPGSSSR